MCYPFFLCYHEFTLLLCFLLYPLFLLIQPYFNKNENPKSTYQFPCTWYKYYKLDVLYFRSLNDLQQYTKHKKEPNVIKNNKTVL